MWTHRWLPVSASRALTLLAVAFLGVSSIAVGQNIAYTEALLDELRQAAGAVPGELPTSLRVLRFTNLNHVREPASIVLEDSPVDSVTRTVMVFQIAFPRGWIMVDAGMDIDLTANRERYSQDRYDRVQLALRDARLNLVTHEHYDHVAGVIRSPYLPEIAPKTMLTRSQVQTLLNAPRLEIRLDSIRASRYRVVDYDRILPVAPGVVLIKAAGHTTGSQMVFVRLASGQEVVLAGDVSAVMPGIEAGKQRPAEASSNLREDRDAIRPQLAWLRYLTTQGVAVVPGHDSAWVGTLLERGILQDDVDLRNP